MNGHSIVVHDGILLLQLYIGSGDNIILLELLADLLISTSHYFLRGSISITKLSLY